MKSFTLFLVFLFIVLIMILIIVGAVVLWSSSATVKPAAAPVSAPAPQATAPAAIVASDTVMVATGTGGQFLVGPGGMTLYYFSKDTATKSNCTGACATIWPIFYTENIVVSAPLQQSDFSTLVNAGKEQTTYKGHPLYYYSKDVHPGNTLGKGVGGVWFLVQP